MYKAIIIEDEYLLANVIENHISFEEEIELVGKFENPLEGLKYLHVNKIDLVFLDIQMPLLSGVDLAKMIPKDIAVIFTTAYSEFALEAFEINALDYLLKPISRERLNASILRFLNSKKVNTILPEITTDKTKHITVKADGDLHRIDIDKLLYIESLKEYVRYCTREKKYIVYGSLSKIADELAPNGFIRIHKSVVVSKQHITTVRGNQVILENGTTFTIGRSFKKTVIDGL